MSAQTGNYVSWLPQIFPEQGEWTEEDYFALPDTTNIIELSDGVITMAPPPVPKHQRIVRKLAFPLEAYVASENLGEIFFAPIAVRLWEGKIREPDILFLKSEHLNQVTNTHIEGAPDWIAEVISPGSKKLDTQEKLAEYAQAGIPEYWLVDPKAETTRVHILSGDTYSLHSTYKRGDIAKTQTIPGFEIEVNEVFNT